MSALHNYQHIEAAIPKEIRDQIRASFIRDHTTVRLHAAGLLRSKKGKNPSDATSQRGEELSAEQPAFDCVKKTRSKGKGKGKAPPIQPTTETVGPSNLSDPHSQTLIPPGSELTPQDHINASNRHFLFRPSQLISQPGPSTAPVTSPFAGGSQAPPMSYLPPPTESFVPYGAAPQRIIDGVAPPLYVHYTVPPNTYYHYPPYVLTESQIRYSFGS